MDYKLENQYEIDWEAADVIDKINNTIKFFTKAKRDVIPTSVAVGKSPIIVGLAVSVWGALTYLSWSMNKTMKMIAVVVMMRVVML